MYASPCHSLQHIKHLERRLRWETTQWSMSFWSCFGTLTMNSQTLRTDIFRVAQRTRSVKVALLIWPDLRKSSDYTQFLQTVTGSWARVHFRRHSLEFETTKRSKRSKRTHQEFPIHTKEWTTNVPYNFNWMEQMKQRRARKAFDGSWKLRLKKVTFTASAVPTLQPTTRVWLTHSSRLLTWLVSLNYQ